MRGVQTAVIFTRSTTGLSPCPKTTGCHAYKDSGGDPNPPCPNLTHDKDVISADDFYFTNSSTATVPRPGPASACAVPVSQPVCAMRCWTSGSVVGPKSSLRSSIILFGLPFDLLQLLPDRRPRAAQSKRDRRRAQPLPLHSEQPARVIGRPLLHAASNAGRSCGRL